MNSSFIIKHNDSLLMFAENNPRCNNRKSSIIDQLCAFVLVNKVSLPCCFILPGGELVLLSLPFSVGERGNLTDCMSWSMHVLSLSIALKTDRSFAHRSLRFASSITVPAAPRPFQVIVTGSTSLRVMWSQPPQGKGRIRYFSVEWFKASEDGNIQGTRQKKVVSLNSKLSLSRYTTDITNLEPNT